MAGREDYAIFETRSNRQPTSGERISHQEQGECRHISVKKQIEVTDTINGEYSQNGTQREQLQEVQNSIAPHSRSCEKSGILVCWMTIKLVTCCFDSGSVVVSDGSCGIRKHQFTCVRMT